MSTGTTNYGFTKDDPGEFYDVSKVNANLDSIDAQIKSTDNKASNITVPVTSVNTKTGDVILNAGDIKAADGSTLETHLADISSQVSGKGASLIGLNDNANKFTATDVEAGMLELFTFANDGKIAVANSVNAKGISAKSSDTFTALATKIDTPSLVNTADATVVAGGMLSGQSGYKNGAKITGIIASLIGGRPLSTSAGFYEAGGNIYSKMPNNVYLTGDDNFLKSTDTTFIPTNILSGKSPFGVGGSAPNITNSASTPSGGYDNDYWIQP